MNTALTKDQLLADRLDLPVAAIDTEVTLGDVGAKLAYRDNACYHLTIDGDCPDNPGEIAVSRRTATARDLKVGDRLTVRMGPATGGARQDASTISGVYTPTDGDARTGAASYFSAAGRPAVRATPADALFSMTEDDLAPGAHGDPGDPPGVPGCAPTGSGSTTSPGLRDGIQTLGDRLRGEELEVSTTLPAVLRDVDADQAASGGRRP